MSTSYNKHTRGSRVGNWVEEEALKDFTGTSRYEVSDPYPHAIASLPRHSHDRCAVHGTARLRRRRNRQPLTRRPTHTPLHPCETLTTAHTRRRG